MEKVYMQLLQQLREDKYGQWQWNEGVMIYGLVKAFEASEDSRIIEFIKEWVDYHIEKQDFGLSINTTAPLLGVIKLLEFEPENKTYYYICERFAKWCLSEAPRADAGCFEHSCTHNKYPNQIWADTLFMGCIFLVKWGVFTNDDMYIKEALRQFELHYRFLRDEKTALIYHGYDCDVREHKGVLWGRGNCWLAVAAVEVLDILDETFNGYQLLKTIYCDFMKGIISHQDANGGWHTVIDKESTYIEMTATVAFAYSIKKGIRTGILDKSSEESGKKAIDCLVGNIDNDGKLMHGSGGTCVMESSDDYNNVPFAYSYYGQGLALMTLSEIEI